MNCKFKDKCNNYSNYEKCNNECFAYVVLHGVNGKSGYWGSSRIPEKYKECTIDNLPIGSDNPDAEKVIKRYCSDFDKFVLDKGMGLFLFSIPNAENRLGTGTGKTCGKTNTTLFGQPASGYGLRTHAEVGRALRPVGGTGSWDHVPGAGPALYRRGGR